MHTPEPYWVAVWTRSRHEKLVRDQLVGQNIEAYLPLMTVYSRRKDRRALVDRPVFPGYLFAHSQNSDLTAIKKTRGVVTILGPEPGVYSRISDEQVEAVRTMVESQLAVDPFPYLEVGKRVRVKTGPLMGLEGLLTEKRKHLKIVVNVDLLGQAVATEISADEVELI